MVRRRLRPLIAFAAVIAAAGSVTAAGLTFTAHTVSQTIAQLPEVKTRVLPSYVVRLPEAKAADLDVSKVIAVRPTIKVPVTVTAPPAVEAVVTQPAIEPAPQPTLVAEQTPEPAAAVEQPVAQGTGYVVRSDVFVRSGPSNRSGRVTTLSSGTSVKVTGEDSGWMKVSYSGGSGWVYQRYLARSHTTEVAEVETGRAPF